MFNKEGLCYSCKTPLGFYTYSLNHPNSQIHRSKKYKTINTNCYWQNKADQRAYESSLLTPCDFSLICPLIAGKFTFAQVLTLPDNFTQEFKQK